MTFADTLLANVWAAALLAAWAAAAWAWVRGRLFPAWERPERLALAYALAAAGLTSTTATLAHLLGAGLYAGGTGSMLLALGARFWLRRRAGAARGTARARAGGRDAGFWLLLALANLPVALIAVFNHSLDWPVHYWNAAAIQNDWLPLPYPTHPDMDVPYHYAVDLWAAVVGLAVPVDREWIFDGLTVAAWNACALLATGLAREVREMPRARALAFVLAFSLLGGGLLWLLFPLAQPVGAPALERAGLVPALFVAGTWGPLPTLAGQVLNFPVLHYFFNLPFALGFPLGFAALHLYAESARTRSRAHIAACALVLGALSLAQVAVFAVLGLAFGLYALVDVVGRRAASLRRAGLLGPTLAIGAGALGLAFAQGGVFARGDGGLAAGSVRWFGGLRALEPLDQLVYWLALFGISGIAGLWGAFRAARRGETVGMLLALVAVVGIAFPYVVWFTASPVDNFKFLTIASVALGLLAATAVDAMAERLSGRAGAVLIALAMLASVGTPLLHVVARLTTVPDFLLVVRGEASRAALLPSRTWEGERAAARWLAGAMGREDLLLALPPGARETSYLLAFAGRFGAQESYSGYPGIALSEPRLAARRAWLERARALEPAALCEPPGLWIYAREDRLTLQERAALRRAAEAGGLRLAYRDDARDGRRAVFEACPHGREPLR